MRTIKFRAWIEKCKSMLEGVTVYPTMIGLSDEHFEEDLNSEFDFDGENVWKTGEEPEQVLSPMIGEEWIFFDDGYILEQFTGVKDKNEVEIYEGDILKHNKNHFFVRYSINQHVLLLRDCKKNSESWRDLMWCANVQKYIKIIGNIHENPELLK